LQSALVSKLSLIVADIKSLWTKNGLKFTTQDLLDAEKLASQGHFYALDSFKNFVIGNVKPREEMEVTIWGETFTVHCNKYRNIGEYKSVYHLLDSDSMVINRVEHTTTRRVADLNRFRLYFQTLLIHHLDSRVADDVCSVVCDANKSIIPIHDA